MKHVFLAGMGIVCLAGCGRGGPTTRTAAEIANPESGSTPSSGAVGPPVTQTVDKGAPAIASGAQPGPARGGTLRATGKLIGIALSARHLTDTGYATLAGNEFDYVTPENEMKWEATEPAQNEFRFTGGDRIVLFAESHGMKVKGHTLVWHEQLPGWMKSMTGAAAVRAAMIHHIQEVMRHYRGHVIAWDVVNEAFDDAKMRADVFQQQIGSSYIAEAFRAAHAADPGALLFYNDYGAEGGGAKSDAVFAMVKDLVDSGVPIHGVGLQMHVGVTGSPSAADVATNIKRYVSMGLKVNISELDVSLCNAGWNKEAALAAQETRYHDIIKACFDSSGCHGVTLWGVVDKYSWLNDYQPCSDKTFSPWALAFDDNYQKKPAYTGMLNALLGK